MVVYLWTLVLGLSLMTGCAGTKMVPVSQLPLTAAVVSEPETKEVSTHSPPQERSMVIRPERAMVSRTARAAPGKFTVLTLPPHMPILNDGVIVPQPKDPKTPEWLVSMSNQPWPHIIVQPSAPNLKMDMLVRTEFDIFKVEFTSHATKYQDRVVLSTELPPPPPPDPLHAVMTGRLNVGYRMEAENTIPEWAQYWKAWSLGSATYIMLPFALEPPEVYAMTSSGPALINLVVNQTPPYVIKTDRLGDFQLKIDSEVVYLYPTAPEFVQCPGDLRCPTVSQVVSTH